MMSPPSLRPSRTLTTAGQWREDADQIQKPPFEEMTGVTIEYHRDKDTGVTTTTDIKLSNARPSGDIIEAVRGVASGVETLRLGRSGSSGAVTQLRRGPVAVWGPVGTRRCS
jgi:hypothetical protein